MHRKVFLLLFLVFFASQIKAQSKAEFGDLVLEISEFRNSEGHLLISLFNSEEDFPENKAGSFRVKKIKVSTLKEPIVFKDLPYGEYAVVFLHDENDNGKMDTNFVGIPQEGYGASNNAVNTFSAPKYNEASLKVAQAITMQKLNIFY
jgi:uncharacterized protein (DUF2141 family)